MSRLPAASRRPHIQGQQLASLGSPTMQGQSHQGGRHNPEGRSSRTDLVRSLPNRVCLFVLSCRPGLAFVTSRIPLFTTSSVDHPLLTFTSSMTDTVLGESRYDGRPRTISLSSPPQLTFLSRRAVAQLSCVLDGGAQLLRDRLNASIVVGRQAVRTGNVRVSFSILRIAISSLSSRRLIRRMHLIPVRDQKHSCDACRSVQASVRPHCRTNSCRFSPPPPVVVLPARLRL